MITRLHIENFKSLVDFNLPEQGHELGKFVCLVGMNGSGKSTVLQALDFLAHLIEGEVTEWLERRDWQASDLASRIPQAQEFWINLKINEKTLRAYPRPPITFPFELHFDFSGQQLIWKGKFNRQLMRCTSEEITTPHGNGPLLIHQEGVLKYAAGPFVRAATGNRLIEHQTADLDYEGSILSAYKMMKTPEAQKIRAFMQGLKSLELLTPQAMRRRSRKGEDIGYGGEKLSAFIDSLPSGARDDLVDSLKAFYPNLKGLDVSTARGGWKKLVSREIHEVSFSVSANHMNDGMLRVIAFLAQAYSDHPVLLFDEIENGINPELVEQLVDFLVSLRNKQVFVTTHSPMILNYLEDKVARESVHLLYRDKTGGTRSTRFFDLPEVEAKLEALGPGEVFADTNLTKLTQKLMKRKTTAPNRKAA